MKSVAIQGIKGSYSEKAARKVCGAKTELLECSDFAETVKSVVDNIADYAVIPIFNKIIGKIEITNRLLEVNNLKILEKVDLEIQHVLIGTKQADFSNLQTIYSHPEALKQCNKFFLINTTLRRITYFDTASSVRKVAEENICGNAAIGSREAAKIYGGKILTENIADDPDNWTTFYLLGK